jgi:hypothetical protein
LWPAKNRKFSAEYYPEFSSEKIITMDWMTEYTFRITKKQYRSGNS